MKPKKKNARARHGDGLGEGEKKETPLVGCVFGHRGKTTWGGM